MVRGPCSEEITAMAAETTQKTDHMRMLWDYIAKTSANGTAPADNGSAGKPNVLMSGSSPGDSNRAGKASETPSGDSAHPPAPASPADLAPPRPAAAAIAVKVAGKPSDDELRNRANAIPEAEREIAEITGQLQDPETRRIAEDWLEAN